MSPGKSIEKWTSPLESFYFNGDNVEDIRSYKPGGYHPVHLGDTFSSSNSHPPRYRILHKLGYGSFSTVWLAQDMAHNNRGVAMKFTVADPQRMSHELAILKLLSSHHPSGSDHPGRGNVLQLHDHFQVKGPNGVHDVFVMDVLISLQTLKNLKALDSKRASYDALLGLAYLHEQGIIHNDLHTGNITFMVPALTTMTTDDWMRRLEDVQAIPVLPRRCQDQIALNDSLPKYVVESADLYSVVKPIINGSDTIRAVIIDFGSATRMPVLICEPCTPMFLRAPEIVFRESEIDSHDFEWHSRSDIWSLGCSIYEIVSGLPLFYHVGREETLVRRMIELLGPLPDRWHNNPAFPKLYSAHDDGDSPGAGTEACWQKRFGATTPGLSSLLRAVLQYEPLARPSASQLLSHPWFELQGDGRCGDGSVAERAN